VDSATGTPQNGFCSHKHSLHKKINHTRKVKKHYIFVLFSPFIIEQLWKRSLCDPFLVMQIPFCDAANAKSTVT
jgi:dihydrofolate reductase